MMEQEEFDLIRPKRLASKLNVSPRTFYNWWKKGIINKYGTQGCIFYRLSEVEAALIKLKPNNFRTSKIQQKK